MNNEKDCIFCKILSGELEADFVYRDDICSAFMDIQPINAGHLLVIPNKHSSYLADLETETGAQIFRVAQSLSAALRESGVKCEGVNLYLADGAAAMQAVFHVHLHVIPRFAEDGFGLKFAPTYFQKSARRNLDEAAEKIKTALDKISKVPPTSL